MKIRTRITLFVVGSGFIVSFILSFWLLYELLEQPFRVLRDSLYEEAVRLVQIYDKGQIRRYEEDYGIKPTVWLRIFDGCSGDALYSSPLALSIDLEMVSFEEGGLVGAILTSAFRNLLWNSDARTTFMMREFKITAGEKRFLVQAARDMKKLDEEIRGVFWVVIFSLLFVILILIALGRSVAGKIIRPISKIRELVQSISDRNLNERVPIGTERDEIRELSETINGMLDRLQFSFQRQKEFLFDTSHELKTPLTTIRLAVQELCSNELSLPEEYAGNLDRLESQVLRMERLVKSLLSISSLEALHDLESTQVDISSLLDDLMEDYQFLAESRNIRFIKQVERGLLLTGDEEKLRRAFSNVIDNAVKYNMEEGEGFIEVFALERENKLSIIVKNTGAKVPDEEYENIFEQFYRLEKSRSLEKGGSGLGLAIVKKTIELHGGTISFRCEEEGDAIINRITITFFRK